MACVTERLPLPRILVSARASTNSTKLNSMHWCWEMLDWNKVNKIITLMFSFFTVEFKVPVPCILERNSHSTLSSHWMFGPDLDYPWCLDGPTLMIGWTYPDDWMDLPRWLDGSTLKYNNGPLLKFEWTYHKVQWSFPKIWMDPNEVEWTKP